MRILRVVALVGLLAAATACGSSDGTGSTVGTDPTPVVTTDAPAGTTEPAASPAVTEPSEATTPTTTTTTPPVTTTTTTTTPPTTTTAPTITTTSPAPALVDVKLYLLRDEQLAIAHRDVVKPAVLREALTELLAGPTPDELASGLGSEVPPGTELLDVALGDGVATVDVSSDFERGGGSLSMTARVAQVVFTATQFDNVEQVRFLMDGAPVEFLGGEGIVLIDPQTRSTTERSLTGGVIVDTPSPGDTVSSPFTVSGEGDVFEADFPIEIWANGELISRTIAFAGAWGDWAEFEATITLDAPPGPIELIADGGGGCGDAPECPPTVRTVIPLTLAA